MVWYEGLMAVSPLEVTIGAIPPVQGWSEMQIECVENPKRRTDESKKRSDGLIIIIIINEYY